MNNLLFGLGAKPSSVPAFHPVAVPVLSRIPILGQAIFNQSPLVYISLALIPGISWIIFRTPFGLQVRAVGEHPRAADTLGIRVNRVRYICLVIGGALAGAGGAFLSIDHLSVFMENMTAGRGYIALAAVTFGKWNPWGVFGASLLFGVADAIQLRLQAVGFAMPHQFLTMLPYLLCIATLAGIVGRTQAPSAMGKPYSREDIGGF